MSLLASDRQARLEDLLVIVDELRDAVSDRDRKLAELSTIVELKKAQYEDLKRLIFGTKSERVVPEDPGQGLLFNEAERDSSLAPGNDTIQIIKRRVGNRGGRRRPAKELERVEVLHDLSSEEKSCPYCGAERKRIGEERSEEIEIIPARVVVTVHVRPKYGPCSCEAFARNKEKPIILAPAPAKIASGSMFSNHTAAFFVVSKYADGLPLHRQEKIISRMGLTVSRGTMARLVIRVGSALAPIIEAMRRDIRGSPILGMDETVVQVLKASTTESRMWVARGYCTGRPILLFVYNDSRSGDVAESIVGSGFTGFLQTDGYGGYTRIGKRPGIVHVGCWAHIRREFYNLFSSEEKRPLVTTILSHIRELYRIERRLREALEKHVISVEEFTATRKNETAPVFDTILSWLHEQESSVPPRSAPGLAIAYALGQYNRAIRYVEHPLLTPDNNAVENSIRPFVVGRKAWLFCDTIDGAWASATLYSLVETAKANGHEPYRYLCYLFDMLPLATTPEAIQALLPYRLCPTDY
jgi:transposase